jgi:hypothetical protein
MEVKIQCNGFKDEWLHIFVCGLGLLDAILIECWSRNTHPFGSVRYYQHLVSSRKRLCFQRYMKCLLGATVVYMLVVLILTGPWRQGQCGEEQTCKSPLEQNMLVLALTFYVCLKGFYDHVDSSPMLEVEPWAMDGNEEVLLAPSHEMFGFLAKADATLASLEEKYLMWRLTGDSTELKAMLADPSDESQWHRLTHTDAGNEVDGVLASWSKKKAAAAAAHLSLRH